MASAEITTEMPKLPSRAAESNKGNFGRVAIIAGSRGMSGAAILSGKAALRGGAGLVRVAVPAAILDIVAASDPCYLTTPLPDDEEGRIAGAAQERLLELTKTNDVVAVGPGLGRSEALDQVIAGLAKQCHVPLILDADALNALQHYTDELRDRPSSTIITPHPGEFARLIGSDVSSVQARRQQLSVDFAARHGIVVVLKGHASIVTDGKRIYVNTTGNPGMATGGAGDVLTGLIAALLGQGLEPFAAAQLGVHLHGLAGDLARDDLGEVSLIATDLLEYMPRVLYS